MFDKISLFVLWDFAKAALSEFKDPNFAINLFFSLLYWILIIKNQYNKEKNKFLAKFGSLNSERAAYAKSQSINKEILSNTSNI